MRTSPLHAIFASHGASFEERCGCEIVSKVSDQLTEHNYVRNSIGLSDFSFLQKFTISEEKGLDFLDNLFAGNVAKVRFGRLLHTFLADDNGYLISDCYIANNDEEFIVLCESIVDDASLKELFEKNGARQAELKDITADRIIVSLDGYKAWAVVKELFGTDVLGLPYLSIEQYQFQDIPVQLFRAGKTSEFGYLLMVQREHGQTLFNAVYSIVQKLQGGLCGLSVHNNLRLEGRFFNIFAEGVRVKDPLPLGLQWMIDFDKEKFSGSEAIYARRAAGVTQKIIGVRADADAEEFTVGSELYYQNKRVASIKAVCYSPILNCRLGLALFSQEYAYSGLSFNLSSGRGREVATISMPPIMPKSLTVKLDEIA